MAHIRQKVALGSTGFLGLIAGSSHLLFGPLALGYVARGGQDHARYVLDYRAYMDFNREGGSILASVLAEMNAANFAYFACRNPLP